MLKVEPIPSEFRKLTSKEKKLNKNLQTPPFAQIILGAVGAGKSSLLYSMINNKTGWYKNFFDSITVWQSTIDSNATWESIPNTSVINEYNEEYLKAFYKQIQEQQQALRDKRKKLHHYLFIFDDMICDNIVSHHRTSIIDKIFQTYRHNNVSIIICSQSYMQLNRTTRSLNLSGMFILKCNKKEIEHVASEHCGLLDEEEFIQMYNDVMKKDRAYLFIDYRASQKQRFRDTINHIINFLE